MSEELLQRNLIKNPEKIGKWDFYNIGATSIKALKNYGIIRNVNYGEIENKKVDGIIVNQKNVIAIIENKKPAEFKTEIQKNKAIAQEIEVARKLDCKIIIATDTKESIWVNSLTGKKIKDENGNDIKEIFDKDNKKIVNLIEKILYSINEKNNKILPKELVDPTGLAKQIWQDIWSVSGATPENCLYTFVEIFIFKYLSDLGILKQGINFNHLMERYDYKIENPEQKALEYYANTIRNEIKKLFPESLIDKTTIINGTIFVSKDQKAVEGYSSVFKKVLERFNDYGKLENIDYDFKSKLFESFLKESISKKNWGQFFTPLNVVRAIVEMVKDDIKPKENEKIKICDPACGVGKFLLEPIKNRLDDFYSIEDKKLKSKIEIFGFDKGFDKDEQKTIILAKANMLIYFSEIIKDNSELTKEFSTLFNQSFTLKTNSILGTLSEPIEDEFDLILTNPPYVTSGSSNLKEEIKKDGKLENYYKINAMGVEGLFMEWIIRALKPEGKAFIIIPSGILNRQNDKNLREFILKECIIDSIIALPLKTFFTTPQKTYILAITKKKNKKEIQTDPIFTYLVSEIGKSRDVNRFDIEQNDLSEAVKLFNFFKGNKKDFEKTFNQDKRCKIQPIAKFSQNIENPNGWIIDKWWDDIDLISFGEKKETNILTREDFKSELLQLSDDCNNFSAELGENSISQNFKFKKVSIENIFKIFKGKSEYTKEFMDKHKGEYPVYSSQTTDEGIIAKINTFDYDCECLTWTTDGTYVGTVFYRSGKFSMTTHCGALILKEEWKDKLYLPYLAFLLNTILPEYKIGENSNKRLGVKNIANIDFDIPLNAKGEIDINIQKDLSAEYQKIENIKNDLVIKLKDFRDIRIKL